MDFVRDILGQAQGSGEEAVQNASPEEVDAHQGFLEQALALLGQRGGDPAAITQDAGAGNTSPFGMDKAQLVAATLRLAQQHPEIVREVIEHFPQAQGLLGSILTGGAGGSTGGSGGGIGDLLGSLFKGG